MSLADLTRTPFPEWPSKIRLIDWKQGIECPHLLVESLNTDVLPYLPFEQYGEFKNALRGFSAFIAEQPSSSQRDLLRVYAALFHLESVYLSRLVLDELLTLRQKAPHLDLGSVLAPLDQYPLHTQLILVDRFTQWSSLSHFDFKNVSALSASPNPNLRWKICLLKWKHHRASLMETAKTLNEIAGDSDLLSSSQNEIIAWLLQREGRERNLFKSAAQAVTRWDVPPSTKDELSKLYSLEAVDRLQLKP